MLPKEEMRRKIEDEIIVDCHDEYEVSMSWYYFMEESLKFPFDAKAKLKKKDGSNRLTAIQVTRLASDEEGFTENDFDLEILIGEYYNTIHYSQLCQIKADDTTMEAFAIWDYWRK